MKGVKITAAALLAAATAACAAPQSTTAGTVIPVAVAPSSTPSGCPERICHESLAQWASQFRQLVPRFAGDMHGLGDAFRSYDISRTRAQCVIVSGDTEAVAAILPSPDVTITTELTGTVSDLRSMTQLCATLTYSSAPAIAPQMTRLAYSAGAHIQAVGERLDAINAGQS
jgi:hypothetical protein